MISINQIKTSIVKLLKQTKNIDVYFTNVSKTDSLDKSQNMYEYFHISLIPISNILYGKLMRDKTFVIDIAYINDNGDENDLYNWCDEMNNVFMPYIQIDNRYITVEENSFHISDEVGHYTFTLKFRDVIEYKSEGEEAGDLEIKFN